MGNPQIRLRLAPADRLALIRMEREAQLTQRRRVERAVLLVGDAAHRALERGQGFGRDHRLILRLDVRANVLAAGDVRKPICRSRSGSRDLTNTPRNESFLSILYSAGRYGTHAA